MKTLRTVAEVREHLALIRRDAIIGLAPTMGALHDGHVALFRAARAQCGHAVATIFVNPGQFNDPADLAAYPRQEPRDLEIAAAAGVDAIFVPTIDEIYPVGDATAIVAQGAALGFEGDFRPGHFNSVATVCLKLFNIVKPDVAYFGQKDAQQVAVIRQSIRDLHLDLRIEVVATVRERPPVDRVCGPPRDQRVGGEVAAARAEMAGLEIDYIEVARFDGQPTLVVAARSGRTRLIDNVPLDRPALAGLRLKD